MSGTLETGNMILVAGTWDLEVRIPKAHKSAVIPVRNSLFPSPFVASKCFPLVLLQSHSSEHVDDGEHILKVTPILHLANRDSRATPCVFRDFMQIVCHSGAYNNMQSQNLLRLFIPVPSLTLEDFFFVPEYFLSKLNLVAAYPVQWGQ